MKFGANAHPQFQGQSSAKGAKGVGLYPELYSTSRDTSLITILFPCPEVERYIQSLLYVNSRASCLRCKFHVLSTCILCCCGVLSRHTQTVVVKMEVFQPLCENQISSYGAKLLVIFHLEEGNKMLCLKELMVLFSAAADPLY